MAMELDYDYLAKLVERTQMGDSDAFAELYTATYQKQYRFAYQYTKDSYLAQDILQDVYILVLKKYSYTEESTTFRVMAPPDYIPHLFRHHSEDEAAGTGYSVRYI